jgi:hypothetical protein
MKKQIVTGVALLSLILVTAGGAYAQLADPARAEVPFAFVVSNRLLPAGEYSVTQSGRGVLKIEGANRAVLALAWYAQSKTVAGEAKLVFDRIGDHYFLSQIWEPRNDAGVQIPKCKMERELNKRNLARSSPNSEHPAGSEVVYVTGRVP